MTDQSNIQAQSVQKRAHATIPNNIQTDARISKSGLMWHFQYVTYDAKEALKHLEFQLKYSKDMDGTPHRQQVEAILANMREHIAAMDAFLKEEAQ